MNQPRIYHKANGVQRRDASQVIDAYFSLLHWRLDGDDVILDIGCGSGDVTNDLIKPRLPHNFKKIIGADVSEKMIHYAQETYANKKVDFITLDISKKISYELEGAFDHVLSFYCLHWVQEQRQALENIYNLLKPGGDTLLCFLAKNPIFEVYTNMSKMKKWRPYMEDVKRFISPYQREKDPRRTLRILLKDIGFEYEVCDCQEKNYVYPNLDILRKSVKAVSPFLDRIPDHMKEDFLADYVSEIRRMKLIEENNNNINNNNNNEKCEKIFMPYSLAVIYARKPA